MIRDSDQVEYEFVLSLLQEATKTLTSNSKHGGIRWNTVPSSLAPVKPRDRRNQNRTDRAARNLLGMATMEGWIKRATGQL